MNTITSIFNNNFLSKFNNKKLKEQFWGYFFIVPGIICFAIFVIYPLVDSAYISMFDSIKADKQFIALENYIKLFNNKIFLKALGNTFLFSLYVVPSVVCIAMILSIVISNKSNKMQSFYMGVFYLPGVISIVSTSIIWTNLYNYNYGILNFILNIIGLDKVNWLGNPDIVKFSLAIVIIYFSLGRPLILFIASIGGIPNTYYEAADIDGANNWNKFWKITFPFTIPTTIYVTITTTIASFQIFAVINLMTSGGPSHKSDTVIFLLYKTAFEYNEFSLASAMGVVLFFCVLIFSVFQFKYFFNSIEY